MRKLIVPFVVSSLTWQIAEAAKTPSGSDCRDVLKLSQPHDDSRIDTKSDGKATPVDTKLFKLPSLAKYEAGFFGSDDAATQKSVLGFYAEWIKKYRRMPTAEELSGYISFLAGKVGEGSLTGLSKRVMNDPTVLFKQKGKFGFKDNDDLLNRINQEVPEALGSLNTDIIQKTFTFIRFRLRPPTISELAGLLKIEDLELVRSLTSDSSLFWKQGLNSEMGRHLDYARKRIKIAYARAIRETDTALVNRTRKIQPPLRRIVEILILTKSNEQYQWRAFLGDYGQYKLIGADGKLNEVEYEKMMKILEGEVQLILSGTGPDQSKNPNLADRWVFKMPTLFPGGIEEVHESAVREYQPTFTSYKDVQRFSVEQGRQIKGLIESSPGFIVSEIKPGLEINWDLLNGMIAYSKKNGFPLILVPADGVFQNIDPKILSHPDIHILTTEISNREMSLLLYPNNNRAQPFTTFKQQGRFRKGQQIIMPHHTLSHEVIPTDDNHINQTQLYTTGSVNMPEVPAIGKAAIKKAYDLSHDIKPGFIVVEKIDKGVGQKGVEGVGNSWQVRPVEFRFATSGEPALFVDRDSSYSIAKGAKGPADVKVSKSQPKAFMFPDLHMITANPEIMRGIVDYVKAMVGDARAPFTVVLPDPIDSRAINHHVEVKQQNRGALSRMVENGSISFNDEINAAIAEINKFLEMFPGATMIMQYSNHSDEWIDRDLDNAPTWLQQIANGPLIDEMRFACRMNGWKPLEYLLVHRQEFLQRTSGSGRYANYRDKISFVSDPSRIRTMSMGEPITAADMDPDWNVAMQHHGHQGANGGKGSFKTHQTSNARAITGDAHRMGYSMKGSNYGGGVPTAWIGVGSTAFQQPYSSGGYSSWGVGIATISEFGTMSLYQFDPNSKSFMQRKEVGPLAPSKFFHQDPLVVRGDMDNDQKRREIDEQEFKTWLSTQVLWIDKAQQGHR